MNDLSVYIHIPFCQAICPFCDFNKLKSNPEKFDAYIHACLEELGGYRERAGTKRVVSVFFGGGTPSVMPVYYLERVLDGVRDVFDCSDLQEVSVEMNPEDVTVSYAEGLEKMGVTRVSLGVQSFWDEECAWLGRVHTVAQSRRALDVLGAFSFQRSLDLMYALPDRSLEALVYSVEEALRYEPDHVSCYSLTIEPGTPFYRQHVSKATGDVDYSQFRYLQETLPARGYEHYEISSFAREGAACVHNRRYWAFQDYLGIGVGAHSLFEGARFQNVASLSDYMEGPVSDISTPGFRSLDRDALIKEHIIANLRVPQGIVFSDYNERYGLDFLDEYKGVMEGLVGKGLCAYTSNGIRPTQKGLYLLDDVCLSFF